MQCPVLKRRDGVWSVNIHSSITTLLEEAKWMQRLGLEVPDAVYQLSIANVKSNCDQLKVYTAAWYTVHYSIHVYSYYWRKEMNCVIRFLTFLVEYSSFILEK